MRLTSQQPRELMPFVGGLCSVALALSMVVAVCRGAVVAAPLAEPRLLTTLGTYALPDLGGSALSFVRSPTAAQTTYTRADVGSVRYELSAGAAQGPDVWYVLHAHIDVQFEPGVEQGSATFYAMPNTWTAAMIQFDARALDGHSRIGWHSLGLMDGAQHDEVDTDHVELRFSNYLPERGVLGGVNEMKFVLEEQGLVVKQFTVLADTSVELTSVPPAKLEISQRDVAVSQGGGNTLNVGATISNTGGRSAKNVVVEIVYPADKLQLKGEREVRLTSIAASDSAAVHFSLERLSEGPYRIAIRTRSETGGQATIPVDVALKKNAVVSGMTLWSVVGVAAILACLPFLSLRGLAAFTWRSALRVAAAIHSVH